MAEKVAAVTMMRDEADIAYHSVMHMAEEGMDAVIVADNLSSDGTRDELERARRDAPCPVVIVADDEPGYFQSQKMTALGHRAAELGATWVVPFDADELWWDREDRIGEKLRRVGEIYGTATAFMWNHYETALDDESDPNPFTRMGYRHPERGALPKVAYRYHPDVVVEQGNHSVSGSTGSVLGGLEISHFPYRGWDHFRRKAINGAAAYRATDLPEHMGAHWRQYGDLMDRFGEDTLRDQVYRRYFFAMAPVNEGWHHDPAPFRRWTS
jgi:hypothetical protein